MLSKFVFIIFLLSSTHDSWCSVIAIESMDDIWPVYSRVDFFWSSCGRELNELALDLKNKKPIGTTLLRKIHEEIQKKPTSITEEAIKAPLAFYTHINQSIEYLRKHREEVEENGINYVLFLNELKIIKFLHSKMR